MLPLTHTQFDYLTTIGFLTDVHNKPPTLREVADEIGSRTRQAAHAATQRLRAARYLVPTSGKHRGVCVLSPAGRQLLQRAPTLPDYIQLLSSVDRLLQEHGLSGAEVDVHGSTVRGAVYTAMVLGHAPAINIEPAVISVTSTVELQDGTTIDLLWADEAPANTLYLDDEVA